jgi:hypothetical protein
VNNREGVRQLRSAAEALSGGQHWGLGWAATGGVVALIFLAASCSRQGPNWEVFGHVLLLLLWPASSVCL